jgi:hypothetical protein
MTRHFARLTLAATMALVAGALQAQGLPTSQPKYLQIFREEVKLGRNADHEKLEAGWPAAFERAKSTDYYLAMVATTGTNEAWFVIPQESNAAVDASMRRQAANKQLTMELERLGKADADMLTNVRSLIAMARPDLSYGAYPDIGKQRFWEITWFRVRPGHEQQWEGAAKAYVAATKRTVPGTSFRVYEIAAGMPGPTYLIFSSVVSYADFDQMASEGQKIWTSMTPDEMGVMQKFSTEGLISAETNRFRLSPTMSYVPKAVRDSDPAFWSPKKAVASATAQQAVATTP